MKSQTTVLLPQLIRKVVTQEGFEQSASVEYLPVPPSPLEESVTSTPFQVSSEWRNLRFAMCVLDQCQADGADARLVRQGGFLTVVARFP